jgi:hypothetical protein
MDEFTVQCLHQNLADFKAGRISSDRYMNTLLSLFTHKSGGYINDKEFRIYPDCLLKESIVVSESETDSE